MEERAVCARVRGGAVTNARLPSPNQLTRCSFHSLGVYTTASPELSRLHLRVSASRFQLHGVYLMVQSVKNLPTMQKSLVPSLSVVDPLEKEMATHSSILAWEIPWTEEPGRLHSPRGCKSSTRLSH
ncbi:unnamed protein product [Rangifer tarandus platyrhynchus]|uniref:Uncharacterized protein n=1 Tax=Rangifer tarandus platyrhynchus TaxID=3082113 RepID=A0AC59YEY7_RANTA